LVKPYGARDISAASPPRLPVERRGARALAAFDLGDAVPPGHALLDPVVDAEARRHGLVVSASSLTNTAA
jgi:hypothetical protein